MSQSKIPLAFQVKNSEYELFQVRGVIQMDTDSDHEL